MATANPPNALPDVFVGSAVLVHQRGKHYRGIVEEIDGKLRLGRSIAVTYSVKVQGRRYPLTCQREELEPVRDAAGHVTLPLDTPVRVLPPDGPLFQGKIIGHRYEVKDGQLLWSRYKVQRADGQGVTEVDAANVEARSA